MDALVWAQTVDRRDSDRFFDSLRQAIVRERQAADGRDITAVLRFDGHGGAMQRFAFSRAVARTFRDTARVIDIGTRTGSMVDLDQVVGQDEVSVFRIAPAPYADLVPFLRTLCDQVYLASYIVKGYSRDPDIQADMDRILAHSGLSETVDKVPGVYNVLGNLGKTTWELMSLSSGIEVTPDDMWLPTDVLAAGDEIAEHLAAPPGSSNARRAALRGVGRYAVIHNTPGGRCVTKAVPFDTMQRAIDTINGCGYRVVQVGTRDEPRYKHVIDRRGLRWPLTAQVMQGASFFLGLEGGLAYMAYCTQTPAIILFGCTPPALFSFAGNTNVCMDRCPSCFWGWEGWHAKCIRGKQNPQYPFCENQPTPDEVESIVVAACERHRERSAA